MKNWVILILMGLSLSGGTATTISATSILDRDAVKTEEEQFLDAILDEDEQTIEYLLKKNPLLGTLKYNGANMLHVLIKLFYGIDGIEGKGRLLNMFEILIKNSPEININGLNKEHETPLLRAINDLDYETSKYLLENGADPNISNKDGEKPLYVLVDKFIDGLEELIDASLISTHKPNVDLLLGFDTVFNFLENKNGLEIIRALMKNGTKISAKKRIQFGSKISKLEKILSDKSNRDAIALKSGFNLARIIYQTNNPSPAQLDPPKKRFSDDLNFSRTLVSQIKNIIK